MDDNTNNTGESWTGYNLQALHGPGPVFLCGLTQDAQAVERLQTFHACALDVVDTWGPDEYTEKAGYFLDYMERERPAAPLVLLFEATHAGQQAAQALAGQLSAAGFSAYNATPEKYENVAGQPAGNFLTNVKSEKKQTDIIKKAVDDARKAKAAAAADRDDQQQEPAGISSFPATSPTAPTSPTVPPVPDAAQDQPAPAPMDDAQGNDQQRDDLQPMEGANDQEPAQDARDGAELRPVEPMEMEPNQPAQAPTDGDGLTAPPAPDEPRADQMDDQQDAQAQPAAPSFLAENQDNTAQQDGTDGQPMDDQPAPGPDAQEPPKAPTDQQAEAAEAAAQPAAVLSFPANNQNDAQQAAQGKENPGADGAKQEPPPAPMKQQPAQSSTRYNTADYKERSRRRNQEIIDYVHAHPEIYLQRDKSGRGFICPICGSGSGKHGTGLSTGTGKNKGVTFTCFAGNCFPAGSDIIEIIAAEKGLTGAKFPEKLAAAAAVYGLSMDIDDAPPAPPAPTSPTPAKEAQQEKRAELPDQTENFKKWAADIEKTDYHRGISLETLKKYSVGYCEHWTHPNGNGKYFSRRLIIPTGPRSYLARDVDNNNEFSKQKAGRVQLYNAGILTTEKRPVFVCEGEIDALSIIDAGAPAVALSSIGMKGHFLDYVQTHRPAAPLVLSLDNDQQGQKTEAELYNALSLMGVKAWKTSGKLTAPYKDVNEKLQKDRAGLIEAVKAATEAAQMDKNAQKIEALNIGPMIDALQRDIETGEKTPIWSTGWTALDNLLGGGFLAGLVTIGAPSGGGKTTFALQLAHYIAKTQPIIYFSLEMDARALLCRTLSRLMAENDPDQLRLSHSLNAAQLMRPAASSERSETQNALINTAFSLYKDVAPNFFLVDGQRLDRLTPAGLRSYIDIFADAKDGAPVVFVDYLQLLDSADGKADDRQRVNDAIRALKKISVEYGAPVFAISSYNRAAYNAPAGFEAFKESGLIEFSSDYVLALQPEYLQIEADDKKNGGLKRQERIAEEKEAEKQRIKEGGAASILCEVLKNRNGRTGGIKFDYFKPFNIFTNAREKDDNTERDNILPNLQTLSNCTPLPDQWGQ